MGKLSPVDTFAKLDLRLLSKAVDPSQLRHILGLQATDAIGEGGDNIKEECLAVVKQALEDRLDLVQCLNVRLAELSKLQGSDNLGRPNSKRLAMNEALDALRDE